MTQRSLMNPHERNFTIAGTMVGALIGFTSYACVLGVHDMQEEGRPNMLALLGFVVAGGIVGGVIGDKL